MESCRAALEEARNHAKKLGGLIADGVMEQDDRRYVDALDVRDAAQAAFDRRSGDARDHRDELGEFAAAVDALTPERGAVARGGFEAFDVIRGRRQRASSRDTP